jgi:hypothetical protein
MPAQWTGTPWTVETLVDELRSRGLRVEKRGDSWWSQCPCPEHRDRNPSLQIKVGDKVPVIARCQSRCSQEAVWAAIGSPGGWQSQPPVLQLPETETELLCPMHCLLPDDLLDPPPSTEQKAARLDRLRLEQSQRIRRVRLETASSSTKRSRGGDSGGSGGSAVALRSRGAKIESQPCALLEVPSGMGKVQRAVLADLVEIVNARLRAGDRRAVPYASTTAGVRLGIDPRRVRDALERLRARKLVVKVDELPNARWNDGAPLYALAVFAPCPLCASDVEAAAIVGLEDEASAAAADAEAIVEPGDEVVEDVPVLLAELEDVAAARLAAPERDADAGVDPSVSGHAAERYAAAPTGCPFEPERLGVSRPPGQIHSTLMSKGPGRTMKAVEALITDQPQAIHDLACQLHGVSGWDDLTRAQVESVRRACKRLAALGRAELEKRSSHHVRPAGTGKQGGTGSNPRYLAVRTPRTDHERDADRQRVVAAVEHVSALGRR